MDFTTCSRDVLATTPYRRKANAERNGLSDLCFRAPHHRPYAPHFLHQSPYMATAPSAITKANSACHRHFSPGARWIKFFSVGPLVFSRTLRIVAKVNFVPHSARPVPSTPHTCHARPAGSVHPFRRARKSAIEPFLAVIRTATSPCSNQNSYRRPESADVDPSGPSPGPTAATAEHDPHAGSLQNQRKGAGHRETAQLSLISGDLQPAGWRNPYDSKRFRPC